MGLYLGNKPGVIYKGDYKPVNLYLGGKKVAGWQNVAKSGEAVEWDETYNDFVGGTIIGRSMQTQTVQGKNLFDIGYLVGNHTGSGCTCQITTEGEIKIKPIVGSTLNFIYADISINKRFTAGTYTWQFKANSHTDQGNYTYVSYMTLMDGTTTQNENTGTRTFASPFTMTKLRVYFRVATTDAILENQENTYSNIQLEIGSAVTAYEPFVPNSPSTDYPSPIYSAGGQIISRNADGTRTSSILLPTSGSAGDAEDTAEYVGNNTWKFTQRTLEKVFDGTENLLLSGGTGKSIYFYFYSSPVIQSPDDLSAYCTHYKLQKGNSMYYGTVDNAFCAANSYFGNFGNRFCAFRDTVNMPSVAAAKSYLAAQYAAGTPLKIRYQLATPIVTYLNLGVLKSFPRYTRIEQTGDVPAILNLTAKVVA